MRIMLSESPGEIFHDEMTDKISIDLPCLSYLICLFHLKVTVLTFHSLDKIVDLSTFELSPQEPQRLESLGLDKLCDQSPPTDAVHPHSPQLVESDPSCSRSFLYTEMYFQHLLYSEHASLELPSSP
ncbi:hypothetical protein RRG08_028285 [Elysia crispata]|uniref:Uncharacterized protein n=1 Tax=Elysia crispata TaxID=231223 RepID=A0AAE1AW53_9GAST|nr:hypothetical protein RRG08_028285 [Elysia crispata]